MIKIRSCSNLLLDPYFKETMQKLIPAWRKVAAAAVAVRRSGARYDGGTELF